MVRPQLGLGNAVLEFAALNAQVQQESHVAPGLRWSELSESEQRLLGMLAATVLGLTLRAAIVIWKASWLTLGSFCFFGELNHAMIGRMCWQMS